MKQAVERQRAGVENNRQKAGTGGNEEAEVDDNTRRFIITFLQEIGDGGCIDSLEVRKKPGGHWIIRDLAGLDLVGLASQ